MGLIRGILFTAASTVFFFAVLLSALFFTVGSSLDYPNVQSQITALSGQFIQQNDLLQQIDNNLALAKRLCTSAGSDFKINYQNYTFRLPCKDVNQSASVILNDTIKNFVSDLYYTDYNCGFIDCFDKYQPTFLISEKSRNYWYHNLYFSMSAVLLSGVALFFLVKKKRHFPFLVGIFGVISALILLGISKALNSIPNEILSRITGIFFSKAGYIFLIMLIISAGFLFAGLVIEFYRVEFRIYNMFQKPEESGKDKNQKAKKK
ncbi:MAG TPA: hypothetical protein VMC07_03030 [Candidatus Omnitrophota bacterium]|nr:hypothetical protein [Candidatus Omnitrophota bacterium]